MSARPRRRWAQCAVFAVSGLLLSCTEVSDPLDDEMVIVDTEVPTTVLEVGFLDVIGYSFCEVVDQVAADIRVYADPASNFGDESGTREAYVGALRAFDALDQVAPESIKADAELMRKTLDDSVSAGLEAGWDVTQIRETAAGGASANTVAAAFASLRTYALEQCRIDITQPDEPTPSAPNETPEERIKRVLAELFPDLDDRKIACLEPRLPLDFDPDSIFFDESQLLAAFAGCRIDLEDPSAPTSVPPAPFRGPRPTTPSTTTIPGGNTPEYGGTVPEE